MQDPIHPNQSNAGTTITITGSISDMPWQHMIDARASSSDVRYVDLDDGVQVVVYFPRGAPYAGRLAITGEVIAVSGTSKRPGSTTEHVEYQLVATAWTPASPRSKVS